MKTKALLLAIAVAELGTGVGLLLAPSAVIELLLGYTLSPGVPVVVGRVAGIALVAIGLICWLENASNRRDSPIALLVGLLAYNTAVPVLLIHSYVANTANGIALWPAVVVHLAFALWIVASIRFHSAARGRSTP